MAMPEIAHVEIRPAAGGTALAAFVDGKYLGVVRADGEGIIILPYRKVFRRRDVETDAEPVEEEAVMTEGDGG